MRYELGDKVRISKHWKKVKQADQLKRLGIEDLETFLSSDEMAGDDIELTKFKKESLQEEGFIAGKRKIKVRYTLIYTQDNWTEGIRQEQEWYEEVYLVATRMNCFRRVSLLDMEFLGGE